MGSVVYLNLFVCLTGLQQVCAHVGMLGHT